MIYAFLDTNLFLHFPQPDMVNWCALLGAERVTLVVPQVVIHQLNEKKDTPGPQKIRERARTSLRWLGQFEDDPSPQIRENVNIVLQASHPVLDFSEFRLSDKVEDDSLIAAVIEFSRQIQTQNVLLVTNDLGLRLKAKGLNIAAQALPEGWRLPEEVEPAEKRVRELEEELRRLRNAVPDLRLEFEGGGQYREVRLADAPEFSRQSAREVVDEIKQKHPKLSKPSGYSGADYFRGRVLLPEEIDQFNQRLDDYYRAYEEYLEETWRFETRKWGTIELKINLVNQGTAPAKDIDVFMHFPDGFDLFDEEGLAKALVAPPEPEKPRTRLEGAFEGLKSMREAIVEPPTFGFQFPALAKSMAAIGPDMGGWTIKRRNSFDTAMHVPELKHNLVWSLAPLYLVFSSREAIKSFAVAYELLAANVPEKIEGTLNVIISA